MRAKRFVQIWTGLMLGFFLFNFILWQGWTSKVFFESEDGHGDLKRVGSFDAAPAQTKPVEYAAHHVEFRDYAVSGDTEPFDILTIGDSFSNGGGSNYYQDYLADHYHLRVLNVPCNAYGDGNALSILYALEKTGWLDQIQPRVVVIESVGHYLADRFNGQLPQRPELSREEFLKKEIPEHTAADGIREDKIFTPIMIRANLEFLKNRLYAWQHPPALSPEADAATLTQDCFTAPGQERLLIYYHMERDYETNKPLAGEIHQNMESAAAMLRQKGIRMVFMPAVGKLDLYYPYLQNKAGLPENPVFSELAAQPHTYLFLDTKKILRQALAEGVQDLYWNDDTHWSWQAQQRTGDELLRLLQ